MLASGKNSAREVARSPYVGLLVQKYVLTVNCILQLLCK